MVSFNELSALRDEKIDLVKMALSNYTSPYIVGGYDAVTLNNLSNYMASNIIYKKRKDYSENDLSDVMYRYAYRYFTQFVTPRATIDLIETMILYNKYMVFNITSNTLENIFGIRETYGYEMVLAESSNNKLLNEDMTFRLTAKYLKNTYSNNGGNNGEYVKTFKLPKKNFDTKKGSVVQLTGSDLITTEFELNTSDAYSITNNNTNAFNVTLNRKYKNTTTGSLIDNITNNLTDDIYKIIDSMLPSTEESIEDMEIRKSTMFSALKVIKSDGTVKRVVTEIIKKYSQVNQDSDTKTKLSQEASNILANQIKYTGVELEEFYTIFEKTLNNYEAENIDSMEDFEEFMFALFVTQGTGGEEGTPSRINNFTVDISKYMVEVQNGTTITYNPVYIKTISDILSTHVSVYLYKYFILMNVREVSNTSLPNKDKAINKYEIDQISKSVPINYINVVHNVSLADKQEMKRIVSVYKLKQANTSLLLGTLSSNEEPNINRISLTYQYKELQRDIYDLFMQDQAETKVALWLTKSGGIKTLFNEIYINNYNESAWHTASNIPISLSTLYNNFDEMNEYDKIRSMVGNVINFREKEYLEIVGYMFNDYADTYYGATTEHRQEIALFIRSYQDVRDYYFKNILLKSIVNDDAYPLYEYILLVTMALDRYFSKKLSKHKELDAFNTEDINNFLDSFGLSELNKYDNFYGSFDYKMSVIKNYNNLIKNKGTRKVRSLIENMLNEGNEEYKIKINEYYIAKSTKDSIHLINKWLFDPNDQDNYKVYSWENSDWAVYEVPYELPTDEGNVWLDKNTNTLYTKNAGEWNEGENIPTSKTLPEETPEQIGMFKYSEDNDKTIFINVPEGTSRPITSIRSKVNSNSIVDYEKFISSDGYWSKDITQSFINSAEDGLNLNISKTKYLSISASINMEVAKIMNMYIMSILDNLFSKMSHDLNIDVYQDDAITLTNVGYKDLIKYIKFITMHISELIDPYVPEESSEVLTYYGVPDKMDETKLDNFILDLKEIVTNVSGDEINEFMKDMVEIENVDPEQDPLQTEVVSMNKYKYDKDTSNNNKLRAIPGTGLKMSSRKDGSIENRKENSFTIKLRKLILGIGYSSPEFQNSAEFVLDLLESTNLISIIEVVGQDVSITKAKYQQLLNINGISSNTVEMGNLYATNLTQLVQFLKDYTENKIFREDYTMRNSTVTNTLSINDAFVRIVDLVMSTFFERSDSVYLVPELESMLVPQTEIDAELPSFMREFITDLKNENLQERYDKLKKYNEVLNSLNTVLTYMTGSTEYSLMSTVNTINKNFSDADYLNFLISMLSFFMSYKVTMYEENHQIDLSNPRESFIFAESLRIWSEFKIEEDWFFDEEIIEMDMEV